MSKVTIDLTNYKDRTGTRVPPGRYRVQVEDVEETTASTGSKMINLWFRVMGGDQDGSTIIDRLVLSEKALFRVVGFMNALGIPTPKKRLSVDISKWNGKVLDIDVEDGEPYNGRIRSEVRGYLKPAKTTRSEETEEADDIEDIEDAEDVDTEEETVEETPKKSKKKKAEPVAEDSEDSDDDSGELDLDDIDL